MPNEPKNNDSSVIKSIAQDVARHVLGGGRKPNKGNKSQPVAILTGQQAPASKEEMEKTIVFYNKGEEPVKFTGHKEMIEDMYAPILNTFKDENIPYYKLEEDTEIPTWVFHQKTFSLASLAPEDYVDLELERRRVLHLPPTVLREADYARLGKPEPKGDPRITLCIVKQNKDRLETTSIRKNLWQPALLLRCPVIPAWGEKVKVPLFELKGIPQGERWYLDQLKLLDPTAQGTLPNLPPGSKLRFFIEYQKEKEERKTPQINKWVLARRNFTGLARPGSTSLTKRNKSDDIQLPYIATENECADSLRLIQMASITNSGGYYLRCYDNDDLVNINVPNMVLVVVVLLPQVPQEAGKSERNEEDNSCVLSGVANSIAYKLPDKKQEKANVKEENINPNVVLRFEGTKHVRIEPYAQAGCVAVGLVRRIPWAKPKFNCKLNYRNPEDEITGVKGFAESIHLVDVEVSDKKGLIDQWKESGTEDTSRASNSWKETKCSGDEGSPLFPKGPLSQNDNAVYRSISKRNGGVAALSLDPWPSKNSKRKKMDEDFQVHYYRTVIRYDYKDVFNRLGDEKKRTLTVSARLRDFYGNRIMPNAGKGLSFEKKLFYTDPLIPPAEWPGFEFALYSNGSGLVTLRARYVKPDTIRLFFGDIKDLSQFATKLSAEHKDNVSSFLYNHLTKDTLDALTKFIEEQETGGDNLHRLLVIDLNRLVDGPCIYEENIFKDVDLRDETKKLLNQHPFPTGDNLRLLNRLLLEDAYPDEIARARQQDPALLQQHLRKLQLVRDQLKGAGDEVRLKVKDEDENLIVSIVSFVEFKLKDEFIEYIETILKEEGTPPKGSEVRCLLNISIPNKEKGPLRFSPVIEIIRQAKVYVPTVHDLPADDETLRNIILDQITSATSVIPLSLRPTSQRNVSNDDKEFKAIAAQFQLPDSQTALARNRFNEHELWFIPNEALPKVAADATFVYSTPRPLSNKLGNGEFPIPDFMDPEKSQAFARVDYDDVGRTIFSFLETLLKPEVITELKQDMKTPLWREVLRTKDALAKRLAEVAIVPMFADSSQPPNSPGVQRMGQDAFQRDLRSFYGVDTFVGLPIKQRGSTGQITNYYGRIDAEIKHGISIEDSHQEPAMPKFSDFILRVEDDWTDKAAGTGYITVTYDLPPGEEKHSTAWVTKCITAKITHIQLLVPNQPPNHSFDQGQWLELVDVKHPELKLDWWPDQSVPVIVRTFPKEPVLKTVTATKFTVPDTEKPGRRKDPESLTSTQFDRCVRWGWKIEFGGDYGNTDMVYLDVDHSSKDMPTKLLVSAKTSKSELVFENLLHVLIVAKALASQRETWWIDHKEEGVAVLEKLLEAFTKQLQLQRKNMAFMEDTENKRDSFILDINKLKLNYVDKNELLKDGSLLLFSKDKDYLVEAIITDKEEKIVQNNYLRLFGSTSKTNFNALSFQPQLHLKRNKELLDNLETNPVLVYECGPVIWPKQLPVSNYWGTITVTNTEGRKLSEILKEVFESILGSSPDLTSIAIRLDARHGFNLGSIALSNPFSLFPVDYTYENICKFTKRVVERYKSWLEEQDGGTASEILAAVANPRLHLGIKLSRLQSNKEPGRIILQIESIEIPMDKVSLDTTACV